MFPNGAPMNSTYNDAFTASMLGFNNSNMNQMPMMNLPYNDAFTSSMLGFNNNNMNQMSMMNSTYNTNSMISQNAMGIPQNSMIGQNAMGTPQNSMIGVNQMNYNNPQFTNSILQNRFDNSMMMNNSSQYGVNRTGTMYNDAFTGSIMGNNLNTQMNINPNIPQNQNNMGMGMMAPGAARNTTTRVNTTPSYRQSHLSSRKLKALQKQNSKDAEELFHELDVDGNGLVTENDLAAFARKRQMGSTEDAVKTIFHCLDKNNDGVLELHEVTSALNSIY